MFLWGVGLEGLPVSLQDLGPVGLPSLGLTACLGEAGAARGKGHQADQHSEPQCHSLKFPIEGSVNRAGLGPRPTGMGEPPQGICLPVHFSGAAAALWTTSLRGMGAQTSLGVPVSQS